MKKTLITALLIIIIILIAVMSDKENKEIKIGVVTALSGGVAYWGESTLVGLKMAEEELSNEGIDVSFIVEDAQLDPKEALSAAQKLVSIDDVDAIYSEFNPASVAVASFLGDKDVFHLYDSAAESPLNDGPHNFKTYLDYRDSCKDVSEYILNNKGVQKVGVLKMNIEHGNLCLDGIVEVFGEGNVFVESYNYGTTDYRTMLNKISQEDVDAIFHASFQPETLSSLRQLDELGIEKMFIGLSETITSDIVYEYSDLLEGDIFFGLPYVNDSLKKKIDYYNNGDNIADYNASALAYVHMTQLGRALDKCDDNECVASYLSKTDPVEEIGFLGFKNRIAEFNNSIVVWEGGEFVEVK